MEKRLGLSELSIIHIVVHCWCVQQGSMVHWCAAVAYLGFEEWSGPEVGVGGWGFHAEAL